MKSLLLPGDRGFYETLHGTNPPGWQNNVSIDFANAFAVRADTQLLAPMSASELEEYLYGGEYDELEEDATSDSDN